MTATHPQGTILQARAPFSFTPARKGARKVEVRAGQRFWVTNTEVSQRDGLVMIDREGKGTISNGYAFAPDQIAALFERADAVETFADYQAAFAPLDAEAEAASRAISATRDAIAAELGIEARGPMGLTPDAVKARPEYRAACARYDLAADRLRSFNRAHSSRFGREISADVHARREAAKAAREAGQ